MCLAMQRRQLKVLPSEEQQRPVPAGRPKGISQIPRLGQFGLQRVRAPPFLSFAFFPSFWRAKEGQVQLTFFWLTSAEDSEEPRNADLVFFPEWFEDRAEHPCKWPIGHLLWPYGSTGPIDGRGVRPAQDRSHPARVSPERLPHAERGAGLERRRIGRSPQHPAPDLEPSSASQGV